MVRWPTGEADDKQQFKKPYRDAHTVGKVNSKILQPLRCYTTRKCPLPYIILKGQFSHEYQQNMAYQVAFIMTFSVVGNYSSIGMPWVIGTFSGLGLHCLQTDHSARFNAADAQMRQSVVPLFPVS
ncbi:hypothetical protein STEG23_020481 [Scotinomys teguina]